MRYLPKRWVSRRLGAAFVLAGLVAIAAGCKSSGNADTAASAGRAATFSVAAGTAMRAEAMAVADVYATMMAQADDALRQKTRRPEVAQWALAQKIATTTAAFTNATQASDAASLLDLLVLAKLKRHAVEDHWIPTLLHDEGPELLAAYERGEREVWAMGGKLLTPRQLEELRTLVDDWLREHPEQYYVSHARLIDIAVARHVTKDAPQVKLPGSVFGLLYLDPLAGLDPVARELHDYRALAERMMYLAVRVPIVVGAQVEYASYSATGAPEVVRFATSVEKFAGSFDRVADTFAKYPQDLATERAAAIDQAAAAVAAERKAMLGEIEAQESRLRRLMQDATAVIDRTDRAGASINASTSQTLSQAEGSVRRALDHAFRLALVLMLVLLVGIPASVLMYRLAKARVPTTSTTPANEVMPFGTPR
jgi:hypothetical protein